MSDIAAFFTWWLLVSLIGWLAWPLAAHFLRWLPDLGYSLSKPFGLLVTGYVFWILGSFGFLTLSPGGIFMALLLVGLGSALVLSRSDSGGWASLRAWLVANWRTVLVTELVFLVAFGVWAWVRALNPEITATEKPMEFAFLNSIITTATQPPRDPWLAGYAISYYYFGYIMIAMLTTLSGVLPSVAFNLGVALLFGLAAISTFGVVLNLIAATVLHKQIVAGHKPAGAPPDLIQQTLPALLGPLLVVVSGNFNGLLELLHHRGLLPASFWAWMDIEFTRAAPTLGAETWVPDRYLWWWQSSRILVDKDLTGTPISLNPIDEFPFFSFLLGDLHPHVLALPFAIMAIGLALNLYLGVRDGHIKKPGEWLPLPVSDMLLLVVALGGLSFLNTWDFPIYLFVVVAAFFVARGQYQHWRDQSIIWSETLLLGLWLTVLGVLFYLPFYIGFRSQAGGILPNPIYSTRLNQFIVMFGPAFILLLAWLGWVVARRSRTLNVKAALLSGLGLLAGLALLMIGMTVIFVLVAEQSTVAQSALFLVLNGKTLEEALPIILRRRLTDGLWVSLLLALIIGLVVGLIFARQPETRRDAQPLDDGRDSLLPFVLVLAATGALLAIGPEFVYLRDNFGLRMNTIFKFYYQAWVLWGVVAAFGSWQLLRYAGRLGALAFNTLAVTVIAGGLVYTNLATYTKTQQFGGITLTQYQLIVLLGLLALVLRTRRLLRYDKLRGASRLLRYIPLAVVVISGGVALLTYIEIRQQATEQRATLDGMAYMVRSRNADYQAIQWINDNLAPDAVIAEAVGGSYTEYARVSTHTGRPTVIGWPGHELQWRGGFAESGGREEDIISLYRVRTWTEALPVLDKYQIEYVYVGPLEIRAYSEGGLPKFDAFMDTVYSAEGVTIYKRR